MSDYPDVYMNTAKNMTLNVPDIRMATAKGSIVPDISSGDIRMATAKPGPTIKQGRLQLWEKELLDSAEVKRKATVAQLCESCLLCQ